MDGFLSVTEISAELGISRSDIRRMIADGRLPASRFGARKYWVSRRDLDEFISKSRQESTYVTQKKKLERLYREKLITKAQKEMLDAQLTREMWLAGVDLRGSFARSDDPSQRDFAEKAGKSQLNKSRDNDEDMLRRIARGDFDSGLR